MCFKASLSFAAVVLLQFYWTLAMGRGACRANKKREPEKEPAAVDIRPGVTYRLYIIYYILCNYILYSIYYIVYMIYYIM